MRTKTLALINGIVGLIGGVGLLYPALRLFYPFTAITLNSVIEIISMFVLFFLSGPAILILGIVGAVYYKGDMRVGGAPNVFLIVGGAVSWIPFIGWITGGFFAIIGGLMCLSALKKFAE